MPDSIKITLSDDLVVTVGPLRWRGYQQIRDAILAKAIPEVLRVIQPLLTDAAVATVIDGLFVQGGGSTATADIGQALQAVVTSAMPDLLWRGGQLSDDLTESLIVHCCTPSVHPEKLTFAEVGLLRDAALQVNDLNQLMDLEKNWWAALGRVGRGSLGIGQSSSPAGTSPSSPSSFEPMVGDPPTSTP